MVFKGGICLFKLYDLARFSDDLDFTGNVDENFIYNAKRFFPAMAMTIFIISP
ncbi:MAG TPA: nucleotidyl transferase AbiEii/AbiGii toxin family protein [Ferroplasma sp.]|nr:nucleotidyl transferase AbiEii/AbiGii toxin family protein [Ferroplasma sp.]HII82594.1 nucleotidyl transferase AbiEii/AbiGii toxin family protein [Ferroplasma sp.]